MRIAITLEVALLGQSPPRRREIRGAMEQVRGFEPEGRGRGRT